MFKTYTIIASKREGRINKVERIVAEYTDVKKSELEATINGLYELHGMAVRIDVLTYQFGKCVNMVSNY